MVLYKYLELMLIPSENVSLDADTMTHLIHLHIEAEAVVVT